MTDDRDERAQKIERVADLAPDRTVYQSRQIARSRLAVHLTPDCRHLQRTDQVVSTTADDCLPDRPICKVCRGDASKAGVEKGVDPQALRNKLANLDPDDV